MAPNDSREDKRLVVALVGTDCKSTSESTLSEAQHGAALLRGRKDRPSINLHERNDPCTGQKRLYACFETSDPSRANRLSEIQLLQPQGDEEDHVYSAFLIKSGSAAQATGNGKLYAITDVDPLFFLLPEEKCSDVNLSASRRGNLNGQNNNNRHQWQPLDQILGTVDPILRTCLDPTQLLHLYATMKLGPDEHFYKFSTLRALAWLQRKQETLQQFLAEQREAIKKSKVSTLKSSTSGGAFASGFYVDPNDLQKPEKEESTCESPDKFNAPAKEESIQIICSYLGEEWRNRFLQHLDSTDQVLQQTPKQRAKRARSDEDAPTTTTTVGSAIVAAPGSSAANISNKDWVQSQAEPPQKKLKKETPVSAGVKKLAQVNTKGMKKMTAFFGVSAKKDDKKNT